MWVVLVIQFGRRDPQQIENNLMDTFLVDDLKKKVTAIVDAYKYNYPDEYQAFKIQQEARLENNLDKFASTKQDFIEREIYVIPETLDIIMHKLLSAEEYLAFKDNMAEFKNGTEKKPMSRWFARTFPEFRAGEKV